MSSPSEKSALIFLQFGVTHIIRATDPLHPHPSNNPGSPPGPKALQGLKEMNRNICTAFDGIQRAEACTLSNSGRKDLIHADMTKAILTFYKHILILKSLVSVEGKNETSNFENNRSRSLNIAEFVYQYEKHSQVTQLSIERGTRVWISLVGCVESTCLFPELS